MTFCGLILNSHICNVSSLCCYLGRPNASANVFSWHVKSHGYDTVGLFLKISSLCNLVKLPQDQNNPTEEHRNYELLPTVGAEGPHSYYTAGCKHFSFLLCAFNSKGLKEEWRISWKGPYSEETTRAESCGHPENTKKLQKNYIGASSRINHMIL